MEKLLGTHGTGLHGDLLDKAQYTLGNGPSIRPKSDFTVPGMAPEVTKRKVHAIYSQAGVVL